VAPGREWRTGGAEIGTEVLAAAACVVVVVVPEELVPFEAAPIAGVFFISEAGSEQT